MRTSGATQPQTTSGADEYLSVAEFAARVCLSPKRVRNLMSAGVFKEGYHFFRPRGIAPRFKWSRVVEWLEGSAEELPAADASARPRCRVDLSLIPAVRDKRNGL